MRNMIFTLWVLPLVLLITSCSSNLGTDSTNVVEWEALKALDEEVIHLEEVVAENDMEHARRHIEDLKSAAQKTVAGSIPQNAHNPEEVKQLQTDLKSIMDSLTAEAIADDEMLKSIIMSIHPIVETLMEKSGVPHVHDHEDHEHEHEKEKDDEQSSEN